MVVGALDVAPVVSVTVKIKVNAVGAVTWGAVKVT
jgi:hypothetical protein